MKIIKMKGEYMEKLSRRDKAFCYYYSVLGNISDAASAAGFLSEDALLSGARLIQKKSVQEEIKRLKGIIFPPAHENVKSALRRLIFGHSNDAVKLLAAIDEESLDNGAMISQLDLFGVSELKKIKGGGVEMKFVPKLDALKLLFEIEQETSSSQSANSFLEAINAAANSSAVNEPESEEGFE